MISICIFLLELHLFSILSALNLSFALFREVKVF